MILETGCGERTARLRHWHVGRGRLLATGDEARAREQQAVQYLFYHCDVDLTRACRFSAKQGDRAISELTEGNLAKKAKKAKKAAKKKTAKKKK
jgi:hypothetical protein